MTGKNNFLGSCFSAETLVRIGWDNKSPFDSILCRHLCQK